MLARDMMLSSGGGGNCASQEFEHGAFAIFTFPSARREPLPLLPFQSILSILLTDSAPPIVLCSFESG